MYNPAAYREQDRNEIAAMIHACGLATFVTNSSHGLIATPVPMFLAENEGDNGVLYGHIAKANPQWKESLKQEALAIFQGPNAYITPSWYPSKAATGRVVPTWNYVAVHAYGPVEFFHEQERLLEAVSHLTNLHEKGQAKTWSVSDAPLPFIDGHLRAIVGVRVPIRRIDAKKKLSQRDSAEDRAGAKAGLRERLFAGDHEVAEMMPD